jgi:hypothetical protein
MTQRRTRRLAVALLGCVLALAGCTSSGNDDTAKQLRSVLLQLSDFPPTWRAFPQSDKAGDLLGDIAVCTGAVKQEDPVTTVQSSEFRFKQERIASTAVALKTPSDVALRANSLGKAKANDCAAQAVQRRVLDLLPGATVTSAEFATQPGGVNVAINYAGTVHGVLNADVEGKQAKVYVDAVFLLGSDFYSDIMFVGVNASVPDEIQHVLIDRVAQREQHT